MRLSIAVTAALSGLASASSQAADVYLFRSESATQRDAPPQLQRQLARLIFLQRLGVDRFFSSIDEVSSLPDGADTDEAFSHVNTYGRPQTPLFSEGPAAEPSQLLVILEGLEPSQMDQAMPGQDKAFIIDEAPNAAANGKLVDGEFSPVGVAASSCPFERAINPLDKDCFSGSSSIIRHDAKKDESIIEALQKATPKLARFAETGEMETTVVLLPETSRNSRVNSWSTHPNQLRRRQTETILSADESVAISASESASESTSEPASQPTSSQVFPGPADPFPLCFVSFDACATGTGNCSGHGLCENTLAGRDENGDRLPPQEGHPVCFKCQCKGTRDKSGSVTRWAGDRCEKTDLSVPFALFLGFTIFMLAIITGAVKLVYSVGEQSLPGVLGAGVSKKT